jgi:hypothetical protein
VIPEVAGEGDRAGRCAGAAGDASLCSSGAFLTA